MPSKNYESNQLSSVLNSLFSENASGILYLKTQVNSTQNSRFCLLILRYGKLVYGDLNITKAPSNVEICRMLGQKLNPNLINAALSVASQKINDSASTKQLVELLCKMRVFTWQQVETLIQNQVVLTIERFFSYSGIAQWQENNDCDLNYGKDNHGLSWSEIKEQLKQRQQQWQSYANLLPGMDAIPIVSSEQLKQISNPQVKEHFQNSVDGRKTLIDIADKMERDVLKVAKNYYSWASNDWVKFIQNPITVSPNVAKIQSDTPKTTASKPLKPNRFEDKDRKNLPIVLSVDDSPIIQTTIKRALQEQYNVLLADQAAEALKILNEQPVELLLLDLTMPEVDGLQFCKTIRQIPKFQNLPIVMVTARDGLLNKAKGHLAGTSKYLTKPFKPDELREVVGQYISK